MFLLIQGSQQDPEDLRAYLHTKKILIKQEKKETKHKQTKKKKQ